MARVAVTGSSGKLGRAVVDHLVEHGWDVVALDRTPSPRADVVSSVVDLTDFGQAVETLSAIDDRHDGVDALVHLETELAKRTAIDPGTVEDVVIGNSQQVNEQGANIARTSATTASTSSGRRRSRWTTLK